MDKSDAAAECQKPSTIYPPVVHRFSHCCRVFVGRLPIGPTRTHPQLRHVLIIITRKKNNESNTSRTEPSAHAAAGSEWRGRTAPHASDPVQCIFGTSGTANSRSPLLTWRSRLPREQTPKRCRTCRPLQFRRASCRIFCARLPEDARCCLGLAGQAAADSRQEEQIQPADTTCAGLSETRARWSGPPRGAIAQHELQALAGVGAIRHGAAGYSLLSERIAVCRLRADGLTVVATDGHRLALATLALKLDTSQDRGYPAAQSHPGTCQASRARPTNQCSLRVLDNQVSLQFWSHQFVTKFVDGKFPDYQKVVPLGYKKHFRLDRAGTAAGVAASGHPVQ